MKSWKTGPAKHLVRRKGRPKKVCQTLPRPKQPVSQLSLAVSSLCHIAKLMLTLPIKFAGARLRCGFHFPHSEGLRAWRRPGQRLPESRDVCSGAVVEQEVQER